MASPLKVLVAEDSPDDILLLQRAFAETDLATPVQFLRDGKQTLSYLQRSPPYDDPLAFPAPTLLLLDLKMPCLDGFEVLRWLRQNPELRPGLVVVFTSSEEPSDCERALELGADRFLVKPHDAQEFIDVVRDMERDWLQLNATPECGSDLHQSFA